MDFTKYEFKLLTRVLALKNDNKAYTGTFRDMCEFLCISYSSPSRKKIREALEDLMLKGILRYNCEKTIFTITFDLDCKEENVIKLDREWLNTVRQFRAETNKTSVDWSNLLKVFIFLFSNTDKVFTTKELSEETNLSKDIIARALAAIKTISAAGGFGGGYGSLVIETKKQYEVFSWAQNKDLYKTSEWTGECEIGLSKNGSFYRKVYSDEKGFNAANKHFECVGNTANVGYKFDFN